MIQFLVLITLIKESLGFDSEDIIIKLPRFAKLIILEKAVKTTAQANDAESTSLLDFCYSP
ncbi:hypothetical protein EP47_04435 [Legionella norrlandica]|uniref:Uncharacterized protein n=1 Tax=Legionella norrlandica TaxID=1498499 RepID=A0A0A2SU11_9GAMM|nr:hypothetical protein EP47_04435 [Legionella norrlandica]